MTKFFNKLKHQPQWTNLLDRV